MKGKGKPSKPSKPSKALARYAKRLSPHDLKQMRILADRAEDVEFSNILVTESVQRSVPKAEVPKCKEPDND